MTSQPRASGWGFIVEVKWRFPFLKELIFKTVLNYDIRVLEAVANHQLKGFCEPLIYDILLIRL